MKRPRFNRPGLSWLPYRAGTYGSFLARMRAALSSGAHPELAGLTTRDRSDPAIALLDAWAVAADVLTFYGERDANEGFLRTATEDRSVFELARLIGYRPRPGVSASVFLAYGLEKAARLTLKRGTRVQSVPGPGQLPQTYETSVDLAARAEWNALRPRLTAPQTELGMQSVVYFKGATLGLKPNDPLLIVDEGGESPKPIRFARIQSVDANFERNVTTVMLQKPKEKTDETPVVAASAVVATASVAAASAAAAAPTTASFTSAAFDVAQSMTEPPTSQASQSPVEPPAMVNDAMLPDVLAELDPRLSSEDLQTVAGLAEVAPPQKLAVYAFRVQSGPFGHSAPKRPKFERALQQGEGERELVGYEEWQLGRNEQVANDALAGKDDTIGFEQSRSITLDSPRDTILEGSWVAIIRPGEKPDTRALSLWKAEAVDTISRADYGVSTRATRIGLKPSAKGLTAPGFEVVEKWDGWLQPELDLLRHPPAGGGTQPELTVLRRTVVFAQSERLELVDGPGEQTLSDDEIELDGFFAGIEPGRLLIVEGERADLLPSRKPGVQASGVRAAQVVQVTRVSHKARHHAGDTLHTFLDIAPSLAATYKADTVTIFGNVVAATHGETRPEVLGGGDSATAYQAFSLKQGPLTFVPAVTPSGIASTLEVRVNDLEWRELPTLVDANGDERVFATDIDEDGHVRIVFGDGVRGARVPTGVENVKAQYRVGIGADGNAPAGQISQLMDRPLGAKEVRNPLPAQGGADPDSARQARTLAPLTVQALDRLVSTADYQHFAQLFAGIAKATATERWSGVRTRIIVAVAAAGGVSIEESALHANLVSALRRFGDPSQLVDVVDVVRHLLVIRGGVRLMPGYLFDAVRPQIESALFEAFGFDRRRLGDDLHLSEVVTVMHRVDGVRSVDVNVFATISDADVASEAAFNAKIASLSKSALPPERLPVAAAGAAHTPHDPTDYGRLVYLSPRVPRSVLLEEI